MCALLKFQYNLYMVHFKTKMYAIVNSTILQSLLPVNSSDFIVVNLAQLTRLTHVHSIHCQAVHIDSTGCIEDISELNYSIVANSYAI